MIDRDQSENSKTHQLLGELVAQTRMTCDSVVRLTDEVRAHAREFDAIKSGLLKTRIDLKELKEAAITADHLRRSGIDPEDAREHRKDFEHLRSSRLASEERKPISSGVKISVISAVLIAVITSGISYLRPAANQRDTIHEQKNQARD